MSDIDVYSDAANQYLDSQQSDVSDLLDRIRSGAGSQESGGNPNVRPNRRTGAVGEFQVLPSNVPSWTKRHYRRSLTPEQFQNNPDAQQAVFNGQMGKYLRKARANSPDDDTAIRKAAAMWYGGEGAMNRYDSPKRFRPDEPSFREYTTSVLRKSTIDPYTASANQFLDSPQTDPYAAAANEYLDKKPALPSITPPTKPVQDVASPALNPPVPETPQTVVAQTNSVLDPNSPKKGVLVTPGEPTPNVPLPKIETPQGTLLVNPAKVEGNEQNIADVIGKVDNVADTSKGATVVTKDANGNELSSSIVTSPASAAKQAELDKKMFPQATDQKVVPAQDAVKDRINNQLAQQLGKVKPQVHDNHPLQSSYSEYLKNFPHFASAGEQPMSREDFAKALGTSTSVTEGQEIPEDATPLPNGGYVRAPKVAGKPTDDLNGKVVEYAPPPQEQSPENALRDAMLAAGHGITPDQADKFVKDTAAAYGGLLNDPKFKAWKPGSPIVVTWNNLKQAGISDAELQNRMEQAQNQITDQPPKEVISKATADTIGNPLSPEEIAKHYEGTGNETLDTLTAPGRFLGRNTLAGIVGGAGHTANFLSGALNIIEDLNPQRGDSMREATDLYGFQEANDALKAKGEAPLTREQYIAMRGLPPETKSFLRQGGDFFTGVGKAGEEFQSKVGDQSLLGKGIQLVGNMTSDLPRMMMLPGGQIVNFAVDSAAQTRGQGGSTKDVLKAAGQGAVLGSLLKFAEPFAKGVSTVAATALNKEASPLLQKGVELASVASGVYGTSRVFGDSPEASFDNAVLMSALHINALLGKKVEGKGIEFHDEQGNAVNVEIKDGKVQTTDKPAEIKVAIPESAKLTTVGEATLKPIDTNETKVSEPPTSVGQDEVLPEPKDQTSAAQITNNTGSPVAPEAKAATEPEVTPASETKEVAPPVSTETPSASETKPIDDIRAEMKAELSRRREAGEQLPTGLNNTANDKMFNRRVDKYLSGMREDTLRDWHSTIFDKPETKTVVHPDENINGKEIVAETQDGRVIVPNENNKSGVSIVKNYDKNAPENKPIPQPTEAPLEKQPEIVSQTGPQPTTAAGVLKEQRDLARRSAETSPVTGLPNKVAFEKARPRIEADPNQEITSIDLNNFKAINDKNSHIVGDKALNDAGKALQEAAKSIDPKAQVFHLSGDEYAVTSEKGKGRDILISADEQFSKNKYGDVQSSIGGHTADTYKEAEAGLQEAKKARKSANAIQNPERSGSSSDQGESGLSNEGRSGRSQETGGQKTSEGNTGTGAETSPKVEEPKSPISEKGKPSRVGKDIEAKAIEAKLTEGFEGTAEYSDYKNKEEGKKAADFINANPERAKRIVRGEEKLPDSVKPEAMLVGMEEYAKLNNDVDTLRDLAKSDLTSETSRHAQALQYLRERDPSSPVKLIREVQKAREEAAQARLGKKSIKEAVKIESDRIKAEIAKKTPRKHDWAQFVKDIAC